MLCLRSFNRCHFRCRCCFHFHYHCRGACGASCLSSFPSLHSERTPRIHREETTCAHWLGAQPMHRHPAQQRPRVPFRHISKYLLSVFFWCHTEKPLLLCCYLPISSVFTVGRTWSKQASLTRSSRCVAAAAAAAGSIAGRLAMLGHRRRRGRRLLVIAWRERFLGS